MNFIRLVDEEEQIEEQFLSVSQDSSSVNLGHLSGEQKKQIEELYDSELFKSTPGCTTLVQHQTVLKPNVQVKRMSYRIPERMVSAFTEEVKVMQEMGIVELSQSEWCNPVVLVPKKDVSLRFCIDFHYLNSVSKFDSFPMPRI